MEFTSTILSIFTIVFFPHMATKLKIPPHISVLKRSLRVKDKHNNTWPVEARKVGPDWYLLDGWEKFVADSSVSSMDVLLFSFSGPGTLDVIISGGDGEIKEGVGYHKIGTPKENQKRKRHESEPSDSDSDSDSSNWSPDSWVEITNEKFESNVNDLENSKKGKSIVRDVKRAKGMKSIKPIGYLGGNLFDSGEIPRPTGKYFVTRIKPGRMYDLFIPKDLVDDESLKLPERIKLVDPDGNKYTSLLVEWPSDKRKLYKKGMSKLCRRNFLTGDDYVICEFGEGVYYGYLFVNILREVVGE